MLWLPLCRVCRVGVDGSAPEQTPTLQDWRSSQGAPLAGWLQLPGSSCLSSRRPPDLHRPARAGRERRDARSVDCSAGSDASQPRRVLRTIRYRDSTPQAAATAWVGWESYGGSGRLGPSPVHRVDKERLERDPRFSFGQCGPSIHAPATRSGVSVELKADEDHGGIGCI